MIPSRSQDKLETWLIPLAFPFIEIIGSEFQALANHFKAGFDPPEAEASLISRFDSARLDRMLGRWLRKPHFASKEPLLKSAMNAFKTGDPIPVVKIVLTEIEGVLADAYRGVHGKSAKTKDLLEFAIASAQKKSGSSDSLLLPGAFAQYLIASTFANFDPEAATGTAGSRHAVGHGAAPAATYTKARSLQALLILDQLAFYT